MRMKCFTDLSENIVAVGSTNTFFGYAWDYILLLDKMFGSYGDLQE